MSSENADILRIGRLEDKMALYEPLFTGLHRIVSVPTEIGKIHTELRTLRESRVETKEKLTTLFKAQAKAYDSIMVLLEEKAKTLERDMEKWNERLDVTEEAVESFKLKGWDLLLRIVPWVIAACTSMWAILWNKHAG